MSHYPIFHNNNNRNVFEYLKLGLHISSICSPSLPSHLKWPDNFSKSHCVRSEPCAPPLYNLYLMSVFVMVTISQCVRQYLPLDYYKNPDLYRMYRDWLPAYCWYSPPTVHNPISPDITGRGGAALSGV